MFELHEFKSPNGYQDPQSDHRQNTNRQDSHRQRQSTLTRATATAIEAQADEASLSAGETLLLLAGLGSVLASLWVTTTALL